RGTALSAEATDERGADLAVLMLAKHVLELAVALDLLLRSLLAQCDRRRFGRVTGPLGCLPGGVERLGRTGPICPTKTAGDLSVGAIDAPLELARRLQRLRRHRRPLYPRRDSVEQGQVTVAGHLFTQPLPG